MNKLYRLYVFTKGYKTHAVVMLLIVNALSAYLLGNDVDVNHLVSAILSALGYSTIRLGIAAKG